MRARPDDGESLRVRSMVADGLSSTTLHAMSKLTPKIILEGTRLTRKTDLAFALNDHPRIVGPRNYRYHSPLISAERCGFTPHPWGRGPINFEPGGEEEARAMAVFDAWTRLMELQPHYSWIIDRFHLSARAFQLTEHERDVDFRWLEARLLTLDVHLVLCTRRDGTWEAAREERLLELDTTDGELDAACERIADWMASTGGLWPRESGAAGWRDRSKPGDVPG